MRVAFRYLGLHWRDWRAGRELRCVQNRLDRMGRRDILLVTCLRNERFRLPFFADYYRRLGVGHFVVIDNGSTDGLIDWAENQPDVSVWYTEGSYRASRYGMLWCNDLLRRYGTGRWCICVDPDEFLIYPYMETRSLHALTAFLDEEERPCFHTVTLDAYSDRPLAETVLAEGADPFALCPYVDGDGYVQCEGWGRGTWIRGGPRLRVHFRDRPEHAPALNKIPLVKWRTHYHYRMSTHDAWPLALNRPHRRDAVSPTGALIHFKFVASLREKAEEDYARREHYAHGREYARYRERQAAEFFESRLSTGLQSWGHLASRGLLSPGSWF